MQLLPITLAPGRHRPYSTPDSPADIFRFAAKFELNEGFSNFHRDVHFLVLIRCWTRRCKLNCSCFTCETKEGHLAHRTKYIKKKVNTLQAAKNKHAHTNTNVLRHAIQYKHKRGFTFISITAVLEHSPNCPPCLTIVHRQQIGFPKRRIGNAHTSCPHCGHRAPRNSKTHGKRPVAANSHASAPLTSSTASNAARRRELACTPASPHPTRPVIRTSSQRSHAETHRRRGRRKRAASGTARAVSPSREPRYELQRTLRAISANPMPPKVPRDPREAPGHKRAAKSRWYLCSPGLVRMARGASAKGGRKVDRSIAIRVPPKGADTRAAVFRCP